MFQFARFASHAYVFSMGYPCGWVAPFGNPRIKAYSRLPEAYRRVSRPSSPLDAKASTRCPSHTSSTVRRDKPAADSALHVDAFPPGAPLESSARQVFLIRPPKCAGDGTAGDRFTMTSSRCSRANGRPTPAVSGPDFRPRPEWLFLADRSGRCWWRRTGSNRRPSACKADALPAELRPRSASWAGRWRGEPPRHQDTKEMGIPAGAAAPSPATGKLRGQNVVRPQGAFALNLR